MSHFMRNSEHMSSYALQAPLPPIKDDYKSYDTHIFDWRTFNKKSKNGDISVFDVTGCLNDAICIASKLSLGINMYLDLQGRPSTDEQEKVKKWNPMGKKNTKGNSRFVDNRKLEEMINMETREASNKDKSRKRISRKASLSGSLNKKKCLRKKDDTYFERSVNQCKTLLAALNGHVDNLLLLVDLGASVNEVIVGDDTTIDMIGAGSTPLHYVACGGNAQCCQILIAMGASLVAAKDGPH